MNIHTRQMEFRAACSAAGPKLGDYTQWVRWRAPTEKNERRDKQVVSKEDRREDPARLLSSRPESRGLQPAGAPARLREEGGLTPTL